MTGTRDDLEVIRDALLAALEHENKGDGLAEALAALDMLEEREADRRDDAYRVSEFS